MYDKSLKIEHVSPAKLSPNPWNSNVVDPENEERLNNSIDRLGLFKPVIVRTLPNGQLEILGGEHRWQYCKTKGIEVPIVNVGEIDDRTAKEIGLADNGRYGSDDGLRLAELLSSIGTHEEISSFLPYSDGELESIFSMSSIDLDDLELPEDDDEAPSVELPTSAKVQTHQIMRLKVPIEDASSVTSLFERIMKEQGYTEGDSLTNAGDTLVHLCQKYKELSDA